MTLRSLHNDGRRLVTAELVSGELPRWPEQAYADLLREAPAPIELRALDRVLDETISSTAPFDATMDGQIAAPIHQALPLSRRDASEAGVWRFLTVVHRPDFVRHRWEHRSLTAMKSRFWAPGTRPDSNALCRLWWIAELTREGSDYRLTERVLARQTLANNLFTRELSWYRPAVQAYVDVLEDAPQPLPEQTMRRLTKALSTIVIESRDTAQLRELVRRLAGQRAS